MPLDVTLASGLLQLLFWTASFLFLHTWFIYPVMLFVISVFCRHKQAHSSRSVSSPLMISVIVPVYNGEDAVKKKICNIKELLYPQDHVETIIVSDGSTDRTADIVRQLDVENVQLLETGSRSGKSAAQNLAVQFARGDVLLFTDVDSVMEPESLTLMLETMDDENVGCTGANVRFNASEWQSSGSQSVYQGMEERIREALSCLGLLISINGSAFLVKKSCFKELDTDTGDDFIIPLDLALQGYRTVFASKALVYDEWSGNDVRSELRARSRITLRNFVGLLRRKKLLNPVANPGYAFSLISHKVLRWLSPVLMFLVFFINFLLLDEGGLYQITFAMQLFLYVAAAIGLIMNVMRIKLPVLGHLGMFLLANVGMAFGLIGLLKGDKIRAYKS